MVITFMGIQNLPLAACTAFAKVAASSYCVAFQALYLFFLTKANSVGIMIELKFYIYLRRVVLFGIIFFLPILTPFATWLVVGFIQDPGGFCILDLTSIGIPISFLIANSIMSVVLIYLFVYPILKCETPDSELQKKIVGYAYYNMFLVIVAVTSSILMCIFCIVSHVSKNPFLLLVSLLVDAVRN